MAARFRVSVAFVDKILRRQRTTGSVAALPACGGPAPRLDPAGRAQLLVCLGQQPDATLDEVRTALAAAGGFTHFDNYRPVIALAGLSLREHPLGHEHPRQGAHHHNGRGLDSRQIIHVQFLR